MERKEIRMKYERKICNGNKSFQLHALQFQTFYCCFYSCCFCCFYCFVVDVFVISPDGDIREQRTFI